MASNGQRTLLVSGASGHLGRRVVELLLEANAGQVVAGTRDPAKLADLAEREVIVRKVDFDDDATALAEAFRGVERALIISTDTLDGTDRRLRQHQRAVEAAARAGVAHVVYTSMPHPDPDSPVPFAYQHRGTEEAIAKSGMSWTILRNNWYADFLVLLGTLPNAVASGVLFAASGEGGAAYVTREDCARAAAAALGSADTTNRIYNITGPDVVTARDLAKMATEASGRPVAYVPLEAEAFRKHLLSQGVPDGLADVLVGSDLAKALGQFGPATTDVLTLTGRPPISVRGLVEIYRDALRHPKTATPAH
jgi:NAD(P)H dehydrogenase (quinone)